MSTATKAATSNRETTRHPDALYTKAELAKLFGVTTRMIELMIKKGSLPRPFYLGTSSPRWKPSTIDAHLERLATEAQQA